MLALILTVGFFAFIYLLFISNEIPKENSAQLNILLGGIAAVWAKAIGFFYDSSASSKQKDEALSTIAQGVTQTGTGTPAPISIPDAKTVSVATETGNVTVNPKEEQK
jgi:hypothetical protein